MTVLNIYVCYEHADCEQMCSEHVDCEHVCYEFDDCEHVCFEHVWCHHLQSIYLQHTCSHHQSTYSINTSTLECS